MAIFARSNGGSFTKTKYDKNDAFSNAGDAYTTIEFTESTNVYKIEAWYNNKILITFEMWSKLSVDPDGNYVISDANATYLPLSNNLRLSYNSNTVISSNYYGDGMINGWITTYVKVIPNNPILNIPNESFIELRVYTSSNGYYTRIITSHSIEVLDYYVKNISITSQPTKTSYYINETFDRSGMVVSADYYRQLAQTFAETKQVSTYRTTLDGVTFTNNSYPNKVIDFDVSYEGKTDSSQINLYRVKEIELSDYKEEFVVGESFNGFPTTATVILDDDLTVDTVQLSSTNFSGFNSSSYGSKQVLVNFYYDRTKETLSKSYYVTVNEEVEPIPVYTSLKIYGEDEEELEYLTFEYDNEVKISNEIYAITDDGETIQITDGYDIVDDEDKIIKFSNKKYSARIRWNGLYSNSFEIRYTNKPFFLDFIGSIPSVFANGNIDYSNVTIKYIKIDSEDITTEVVLNEGEYEKIEPSLTTAGSAKVLFKYNGLERESNLFEIIQVVESQLVVVNGIENEYLDSYTIDLTGLVVKVIKNNGEETIINSQSSEYSDLSFRLGEIFIDNPSSYKLSVNDTNKKLYVVYKTLSTVLVTLSVTARVLDSIELNTDNVKTEYILGDNISYENLIVIKKYEDGSEETAQNVNYPDISLDEVGQKTITIEYFEKTASYQINVGYGTLKSLKLDTSRCKIEFTKDIDTYDDYNNLIVYAVLENGYDKLVIQSSNVTVDTSELIISGGVITAKSGAKTIYVEGTYHGVSKSSSYQVDIKPNNAVVDIWFEVSDEGTKYTVGELYTRKGLKVYARDTLGNEFEVTNYRTNPEKNTKLTVQGKREITITYTQGNSVLREVYYINVLLNTASGIETVNANIAFNVESVTINGNKISFDRATLFPLFPNGKIILDVNGYNYYNGLDANKDCLGYLITGTLDEFGNVIENAHVVLFKDYINPLESGSNITVKFPHFVEGYAEKINKCRFGKIFNNRLFVSGNIDEKNVDWHTSQIDYQDLDYDEQNQIAYFSDLDYCQYGTSSTAVLGYDINTGGELVVFKEDSTREATMYKRTAALVQAMDYAGNRIENQYEEGYPSFDININGGDGALSYRTICNFKGDTVFLTRTGLKVLVSTDRNLTNARQSVDCSSNINYNITKEDLENAEMFAYKDRLLLRTSRGIYIGEYYLRNESKEYEWYYIKGCDADIIFELNGELCYANGNGNIFKLSDKNEEYYDVDRLFGEFGAFNIDYANNRLVYANQYSDFIVKDYDFNPLAILTNEDIPYMKSIYGSLGKFFHSTLKYGSSINFEDYVGEFDYDEEKEMWFIKLKETTNSDLFYSGRKIQFDGYNEYNTNDNVSMYTNYELKQDEEDDTKLYILDAKLNGIEEFRMCFVVNDEPVTKITDIDENNHFRLLGTHGELIQLVKYADSQVESTAGIISRRKNIEAYYVTKPFDMGTTLYEKTIWQWSIVNDTRLASYMDVGYIYKLRQQDYKYITKSEGGALPFDFDEFSFNAVKFLNNNLPHIYTRFRTLANVGFIRFVFANNEDSNMVLSKLSVIYTIASSTKGVR